MIKSTHTIRVTSSTILLFILSICTTFAQDPMKVAPHIFRVLFENDRVRVLQEWLRPGEKEPMHSHPRAVVYALNSFKGKSTSSTGRTMEFKMKAGQVDWADPETHAVENTGATVLRAIIVEMKPPKPLPVRELGGGPDPLRVASHSHKLLFENRFVRVFEFHLLPGQRTRRYFQQDRVSYVLSGGVLKETLPSGKVIRQVFKPKQARWLDARSHALENVGLTEVRLFTVELKNVGAK